MHNMFTGIVEEVGEIVSIRRGSRSATLKIKGNVIFSDMKLGDSIAVNGICLTVTEFGGNVFSTDATPETLDRTSLSLLSTGSHVNLERAMSAAGRFGGHIVTGHIDGTAIVSDIRKDDNAVIIRFTCTKEQMEGIIAKGSVAIDGISLTVASVDKDSFTVSVIPHTGKETILLERKRGDIVNLETDVIGKYVAKFIAKTETKTPAVSRITEEYLRERGF